MTSASPNGPVPPSGLNHLVINVRDIEESHRFWTEMLGFTQVGEFQGRPWRGTATRHHAVLQR